MNLICIKCHQEKPIEIFIKDKRMASGHVRVCRACDNKRKRIAASISKKKGRVINQKYWKEKLSTDSQVRKCVKCREIKPVSMFYKTKQGYVRKDCKKCYTKYYNARYRQKRYNDNTLMDKLLI